MNDDLNWNSFREEYNLKNDRYIKDIYLLQRLMRWEYPTILYPNSLFEQITKKFMIVSVSISKRYENYFYLQDFLDIADSLCLEGDWTFLPPPHNPKNMPVPSMPKIPTEKTEYNETYNWASVIFFMIFVLFCILPGFLIDPNAWAIGIPIAILWIPAIWYMAIKFRIGEREYKERTKKLTKKEIEVLEKKAQEQYQKDIISYQKLKDEYEDKESEYRQRLNLQAAALDSYAECIASALFKQCLINNVEIDDCILPPQRGALEDKLFYALMKEIPSYVKVDKSFGCYFPDLVIHNGYSCPIDIEIDEPYDYKTKKEIHYIGCNDEERNYYFESNNWFVIRFTENQIKNHLSECVDIIKAFVHFIEHGDTTKLYGIENTIKRIQEPRWTKEEARMMAIDNYRSK